MSPTAFPKKYALLSNNNLTERCTVFIGLIVSGVLNVTKLEDTHRRLVELWPPLGGRIDTSTTPFSFSTGSIVDFKFRNLPKKLEDLPLIPYTQTSLSYPTFHCFTSIENDRIFHFDTMEKPPPPDTIFALRVTILDDATLLGFRFSHHLCDGQACYQVVKAYCDLLSDRPIPQLIPPPDITSLLSDQIHGEDNLPLTVKPNHPLVHPMANLTIGILAIAKYTWAVFFNMFRIKVGLMEKDDERMVHVPAEFVVQLRNRCQEELDEATKRGELEEGEGLVLSKNDVLTAWLLKGTYATFPSSNSQGPDLYYSFNYRPFLDPLPPNQLYLHNSFYSIRTSFPSISEFQSTPLYRIAHEIRLTIVRNKQPSAVKSALQFWEQISNSIVAFNPPERPLRITLLPTTSHWTTFEYHSLDFSAALIGGGTGLVLYTQPMVLFPYGLRLRPLMVSVKDGKGGYWLRINLSSSWWEGFSPKGEVDNGY